MKKNEKSVASYEAPSVETVVLINSYRIMEGSNTVVGPDPEYPS